MAINPAAIFSTLGNPNSLVPLAVKDLSTTVGMTAGSFVTGKEEGIDRFIDEFGTEIIWLLGIPAFKWLYNKTVFKAFGLDSKFDPRNLANRDVFEKIKQYAPDADVKKGLDKITQKEKLFKNLVSTRFVVSTGLTIASYLMLTKFKQKYTENKIRKNLIDEYNKSQQNTVQDNQKTDSEKISTLESSPSFKGIGPMVEQFAFSPVKNMYILEAAITGTRLKESRSPQELIGYTIKEVLTLTFLYYAGGKIQKWMEKLAVKKHDKSIALDARVLEGEDLRRSFEDGSIEKSLADFSRANTSDANIYEFLHNNPDNMVVKTAKQSDIIKLYDKDKKWYQFFRKPDLSKPIDTREYINPKDIKGVNSNISELYEQYKKALKNGETSEHFFKQLKKLKRNSVMANIGACIVALGIVTPGVMLAKRLLAHEDTEFQTKKEIRQKLIEEGVIA